MASYMDVSTINPDDLLDSASIADYPTPGSFAESGQSVEPEQRPKKKRKAWGQPVPEINPILPPRKRAKTVEEKEQRKNERILRNRRAADKSRQRQKAEVEALRQRQLETEAENSQLKSILAQYQNQYGQLPGCDFNPQIKTPSEKAMSEPSLLSLDDTTEPADDFDQLPATPAFSANTPPTSIYQESPALAPHLNLGEIDTFPSPLYVTGMTQCPAEASIVTTKQSALRGLDLSPLSYDITDIMGQNYAVPDLQPFDGNPFNQFNPTGIPPTEQFSLDSYIDCDALYGGSEGSFSFETTEQNACLQSQPSASLGESSRPDFAAAN